MVVKSAPRFDFAIDRPRAVQDRFHSVPAPIARADRGQSVMPTQLVTRGALRSHGDGPCNRLPDMFRLSTRCILGRMRIRLSVLGQLSNLSESGPGRARSARISFPGERTHPVPVWEAPLARAARACDARGRFV